MLRQKYECNTPIYINDIEKTLEISTSYVKKLLAKWTKAGDLRRFDKGIYYFPKKSLLFGESPFDADKVVIDKYLGAKDAPQGYYSGLALANMARITTQMPAVKTIVTNAEKSVGRNITLGKVKLRIAKPKQVITKDNVAALSLLDLISVAKQYSEFPAEETGKKIQLYAQKTVVSRSAVLNCLPAYPAKISQELLLMGVYDVLA